MAKRLTRLLAAATALIFALLAFVFCVLAIASKEWAVRDGYPYGLNDWNWTQPEFTLYRSPFAVCYATANSTRKPFGFNSTCVQYRPSGFGKTSCELAIATGSDTVPQVGDQRQCQQIHLAGNFGITSVVFTTLGFTAIGLLVIATLFTGSQDEGSTGITSSHRHESHKQHGTESSAPDESAPAPPGKPRFSRFHHHRSVLVPYVNLMLLVFLGIGVITSLISQFYAVEGLVQSAPNNADFASASGNRDNPNTKGNHGPWYQGKALSVYMTCSWGFALAAGVVASRVWRLPNWDVGV
jgi:hypothetical protein